MFSASLLRRVFNAHAGDERRAVVDLVLRGAGSRARTRERDLVLCSVAELATSDDTRGALARKFRERMATLELSFPSYLDAGTVDGRLALALLVSGMKLPCEKTIERALSINS
jgi:hypothetical protein